MKKVLCLFSVMFTVLFLSGCGEKPTDLLDDAVKKMNELESSSAVIEMKMTMAAEGSSISFNMKMDGQMNYKNNTTYFDTSVGMMGFNTTTKVYTEQIDDIVYSYTSEDGNTWVKSEGEGTVNVDGVLESAKDYKSVKKVKSDESGLTKLEITVDKDDFNSLDSLTSDDMTSVIDIDKDIKFYIYINKDKYISKIFFDFSDYIQSGEEMSISEFTMTLSFGDFNKYNDLKVPDDIKENATEDDDFDFDFDFDYEYTEEDILDDVVLSAKVLCEDATIDFSKYNGELDDYLYSGYDIKTVTKGIITTTSDCTATADGSFTVNGKECTYGEYQSVCQ